MSRHLSLTLLGNILKMNLQVLEEWSLWPYIISCITPGFWAHVFAPTQFSSELTELHFDKNIINQMCFFYMYN